MPTVLGQNAKNGTIQAIYGGHSAWVKDVSWSPTGKYIASGGDDGLVIIWDTTKRTSIYTHDGQTSHINGLGWSPQGELVASGAA